MKIAIMQPYFFPYLGYFQLINTVDKFVIYDDIEYTKKGWINRNRILKNSKDELISIPLKKDSDYLPIKDRYLASSWEKDKVKLLNIIKEAYRKAPYFKDIYPIVEICLNNQSNNLFDFIHNSLLIICDSIDISTPIIISSSLDFDNSLKSSQKVLEVCKVLHATTYINPSGGKALYNKNYFETHGINLSFIENQFPVYQQFSNDFFPGLSIIDVMMFNNKEEIKLMLNQYTLV